MGPVIEIAQFLADWFVTDVGEDAMQMHVSNDIRAVFSLISQTTKFAQYLRLIPGSLPNAERHCMNMGTAEALDGLADIGKNLSLMMASIRGYRECCIVYHEQAGELANELNVGAVELIDALSKVVYERDKLRTTNQRLREQLVNVQNVPTTNEQTSQQTLQQGPQRTPSFLTVNKFMPFRAPFNKPELAPPAAIERNHSLRNEFEETLACRDAAMTQLESGLDHLRTQLSRSKENARTAQETLLSWKNNQAATRALHLKSKHNVHIYCRVRPQQGLRDSISAAGRWSGIEVIGGDTIKASHTEKDSKVFAFDRVFGASEDNNVIDESLSLFTQDFISGTIVTIVAYGQSGSGKSFTLHSKPQSLVPQLLERMYRLRPLGCQVLYTIQEVRGGSCFDLCETRDTRLVARGPAGRRLLYYEAKKPADQLPLKWRVLGHFEELDSQLKQVHRRLLSVQTDANPVSSRSHWSYALNM